MTDSDETVREMAELAGVRLGYRDVFGRAVETPPAAIRRLLGAIGFPADTPGAERRSLTRLRARRDRTVPHLIVCEAGKPSVMALRDDNGGPVAWALEDETGSAVGSDRARGARLALPALEAGYYRLTIRARDGDCDATVIAAPLQCWRPPDGRQRWGVSGAVYGLRSAVDFGIGDFGSVGDMAVAAARRGASFFGLSPLHALFPADRRRISPYSPSSRLFVDPIYIDVAQLPGSRDRDRIIAGPVATADLVDYAAVWAAKRPILEAAWRAFVDSGGDPAFDAFRRARGKALEAHALYEVLTETDPAGSPGGGIPPPPAGKSASLKSAHRDRMSFHCWLQWVADGQLAVAARRARDAGMDVGLIADLAVGASPEGSELWSGAEQFLTGVSVGAPPDLLAPQGQEWGLRTLSPFAMERDGLSAFRALVAAVMRHCGGVRIDHVFQLRRLYLVPVGAPPADGAYVRYPTEAMLAVLRVESHRAKCMVIGEDLGTKPPEFPETLHSSGILGYRVIYFERDERDDFLPPQSYDPETLAVINTHDLATFAGWWRGHDIDERLKYGVVDDDRAENARLDRHRDRIRLTALLRRDRLVDRDEVPDDAPIEAVVRLLARCRSRLVGLSLDDISGEAEQQNVPGVSDGPPNWRRRLRLTTAELSAAGGPLDRLARAMAAEGRGTARVPEPQAP